MILENPAFRVTTAVALCQKLAGELVASGALRSPWLRRAFEETPREVFVPRFYRSESGREVLIDGTDPRQHDEWLRGNGSVSPVLSNSA